MFARLLVGVGRQEALGLLLDGKLLLGTSFSSAASVEKTLA
jgi:hypothetical protein